MMELMFPSAPATTVVETESRQDGSYGGALEPRHTDGQGARGVQLRAYNKDRAIDLPAEIKLKVRVFLMGDKAKTADESRDRFNGGETDRATRNQDVERGEGTVIELSYTDPEISIYGVKLDLMETQGLEGALVVMKWQGIMRVDGQTVSDICTLADYPTHIMEGAWECDLMEKHELLVLDNGCT